MTRSAPLALPLLFLMLAVTSVLLGAGRMDFSALWSMDREAWLTLTASRLPRLAALVLREVIALSEEPGLIGVTRRDERTRRIWLDAGDGLQALLDA